MQLPHAFPQQDQDAHIASHAAFMQSRMVQINPMVYANLQSHISHHISLKAQGEVGAQLQDDPQLQELMKSDPEGAQIRIEGIAHQINNEEADHYFDSRPDESKVGAWSSNQSSELESRKKLNENFLFYKKNLKT